MYIQKAKIENIRSITDFEIEFKNPAGWHVLIGDNGAGKSTIIRSIALALIESEKISGLRENWKDWLKYNAGKGKIEIQISKDVNFDIYEAHFSLNYADYIKDEYLVSNFLKKLVDFDEKYQQNIYKADFSFYKEKWVNIHETIDWYISQGMDFYFNHSGFFSCAFGPYRRFEGGNPEWQKVFENPSFANLAAHLSVFDESVALTEPINWLKDLNYKSLEKNEESQYILDNLKKLINSEDKDGSFLQHNAKLESVSSDGVFFKDGNDTIISVNQMSDGYRSVLSMTFELIRQLVRVYGSELVFKNIEKDEMFVDLPGVVLVDEIDAHLHPTWQTRIGQWFLKYFPKLQFIVTTHSPLVCRAAENGSIWRLAAPGSDEKSGEITGLDRERLIYGNILDAYGTEVFGEDVSISQDSVEKQEEMVKLSKKKMLDAISPEVEEKLQDLKKVFTTDAPIEL